MYFKILGTKSAVKSAFGQEWEEIMSGSLEWIFDLENCERGKNSDYILKYI